MASFNPQMKTLLPGIPSWVSAKQAALMVCRSWALSDSFGKHEGRQYILSDNNGFVVQGVVTCDNSSCKMCTLVEGEIYNFTDFQLVPITRSIQFRKQGMNLLDVSRCNNAIHLTCSPAGFIRHPVHLVPLEDIEATAEKYHIDVMGRVIAMGVSRPTKSGNFIMDCHIINRRGTNIRLMLWNEAASSLIGYDEKNQSDNICIFTYMDVREYEGKLYLSSTAATVVYLAESIPSVSGELSKYSRNGPPTVASAIKDCAQGKDHSLTQVLYIGRANSYNKAKEVTKVNCKVKVLEVRKDHPWFSFTCPLQNCQKGVINIGEAFWCNSCEEVCPYAIPSYRLHVDVTDGLSTVTIGFLDLMGDYLVQRRVQDVLAELGDNADPFAPPENLLQFCSRYQILELSSHTYIDHRSHESFACSGNLTHLFNVPLGITTTTALLETADAASTSKTPAGEEKKVKRILSYSSDDE